MATDEIASIGDNDTLAAIVAAACKADLLVLLSDIDGLYTADPHTHPDAQAASRWWSASRRRCWRWPTAPVRRWAPAAWPPSSRAAQLVTERGADMVIANGCHPELLYDIAEGKPVGTRFTGRKEG